ncbi:MAG: ParB N-terminal domain-containing protein [Adlercreutzia equolifaciens]
MPRESAIPIDLPSLDDLFTTQAERDEVGCEKVGVIPLYMIDPFPDHPFRVDDDALRDMAESVSRFGVLVPALVRPKENGRYEMVSGHRRKRAARWQAGGPSRRGSGDDLRRGGHRDGGREHPARERVAERKRSPTR